MHNCEISPPPPPPAKGAKLLLQLGQLIVHSRHPSPSPQSPQPLDALATSSSSPLAVSATLAHETAQEDGHGRLLQAKLLAARRLMPELPSTSKESSEDVFTRSFKLNEAEGWKGAARGAAGAGAGACAAGGGAGLDAAAVGEAVSRAQRALYLDAQLNFHVQALWAERVPVCIDVSLGSGCRQCVGGEPLLLERWTLSVRASKSIEKQSFITSQWLLNAVRSQLHFSQISAWRAKLRGGGGAADPPHDPQERQRRRSRETCNYKKLESNCDEDELTGDEDCRDDKEVRKLNIVYRPRLDGDASDFTRSPITHRFPATDIGADLLLEVLLETLPRTEEIPSVKCLCNTNPPKRRASRDSTPLSQHEELACRMHDLTLGPIDARKQHLRTKGATFSPDLGLINSNIGCSSGISRKLSIFSSSGAEYNGSTRISTPERQFYNDSGYPDSTTQSPVYRGSPSKDKKSIQLDHPYFNQSLSLKKDTVVRANYLLVDDRMHTPCSESGKHRCSCDDESDQGKEFNPKSSTSSLSAKDESGRKVLDERRLKEIAKYKRRLRKEIKLKKMRESGTSDSAGTSECADKIPEPKEKEESVQTTSIPILQASRFDRMRAIGCYRNQTYLTLPANCRGEERSYRDAACDTIDTSNYHTPRHKEKSVASIATQTEGLACVCGEPVDLKCEPCKRKMVRSEASYDLARVNQSDMLLEAMERTSQLHSPPSKPCVRKERDEPCCDGEKVMKKHKCDNNDRNLKCDTFSFSDSLGGVRKCADDDAANAGIIKRPKLKRIFPIVERIGRVVTDRRQADDATNDIDELLLKDDDSVFAYMAKSHSTPKSEESAPLTRQRSSASDDDYVLYEKCDYGTFDRFDNPETLVRDDSDSEIKRESSESSLERYITNGNDRERNLEKKRRGKGSEQPDVPSPSEMEGFRWRLDSAASMVFHARTGLPLTSSPAPLRRGNSCFDYDSTITGISGIKSALFHPVSPPEGWWSPCSSPGSPAPAAASPPPAPLAAPPASRRARRDARLKLAPSTGLLGSFEESALNGRLEPVATVHGFTAELGASGAFCPPHRRLPVTVFFYALGGTNAPYLGHINLGPSGYRIPRSGTVQVSLLNPHGTLVKMFVVLYELTDMPACARTFLRQRTLYVPCDVTAAPPPHECYRWLRYLIHLRFLTSKTGKLYLHTDIRIIVSRKADLDTATAHSPIYSSLKLNSTNQGPAAITAPNHNKDKSLSTNQQEDATNEKKDEPANRTIVATELKAELKTSAFAAKDGKATTRPGTVSRVFGGCDEQDIEEKNYDYDAAKSDCDFLAGRKMNRSEACMELSTHCDDKNDSYDVGGKVENSQNVSYELRSFTYAPDNPKYSPR